MKRKERIVFRFLDQTRWLFNLAYDDQETGGTLCPYWEVYDRFQTYLDYSGEKDRSVRDFLEQDGNDPEEIDFFLQRYEAGQNAEESANSSQSSAFEKILSYFLKDTLELFQKVLDNDPNDPHHSAISTVHRLEDYLSCNPACGANSPRELLYAFDRIKEEVDSLYEQYRMECVIWATASGHPQKPLQTFGKLAVYQVEDKFVVVLPTEQQDISLSAGAEFDSVRHCIWTKNVDMAEENQIVSLSHSGSKQSDFSKPFYQFDFGKQISVFVYLASDAFLHCVIFENGMWTDTKKFDLLL